MVLRRLPSLASCIRVASLIRMPTSYRANLRRTLKSCSRALLNDQLWELLEPLLPPWPDEGARSAAGAGSAVPAGHLVRAAYRDRLGGLPQELGFRSGMTCWRRIKRWTNAGVFDDLHRILLAQLNAANEIDWSRAVIDGSHIDTEKGVPDLEFAPISSPHVSGVEDHTRDVDEVGVIESVQHRPVRPAPHPGPRPDQEPAVRGRLRCPETRRQTPPGTTADQHVDDRREQRLIRRVLRSAAL